MSRKRGETWGTPLLMGHALLVVYGRTYFCSLTSPTLTILDEVRNFL
jgi:hypothetical protein